MIASMTQTSTFWQALRKPIQQTGQIASWLILVAGLLTTYALHRHAQDLQDRKLEQAFEFQVAKISAGIENRMHANEQLLRGVSGFFAASDYVDRNEFRSYVSALHIEETYPGIQGVGFARTIAANEVKNHLTQMRGEGFPGYTLRPPGEREQYSAIVYLEPDDWRNRRAIGFDMYAEPVRQAAMQRARETGQPALSGKVKLEQETDRDVQAGVLLYVPVYAHEQSPENIEPHHRQLTGWVYTPLRMKDWLESLLRLEFADTRNSIGLTLYSGTHADTEALLFASSATPADPAFSHDLPLIVAGQPWLLHAYSLPEFSDKQAVDRKEPVAIAGTLISFLLAILAAAVQHGQSKTAHALERLTAANRELAKHREELQAIYDNASIGIFMLDREGCISYANRRLGEMFALPAEQILGSEYIQFLETEERDKALASIRAHFAGELGSIDLERCYQRSNGDTFWALLSGRCLKDDSGQVSHLIGMIIETTDRHHADALLRQSEKRYRMLTETMQDVAWTMDVETLRFTYFSPAIMQLRGHSPEELIARPISFGFEPEAAARIENSIRQRGNLFGNETAPPYYVDEMLQPHRDGHMVWTEVISSYYLDAETGRLCLRGVTRNIDERKQTEEERRIAAVAFNSHESMVVTDQQGIVIRANEAFTRLNGYSTAEIIGHSLRLLHSGRHDEAFYRHMWSTISQQGFWQGEVWNRRKDGEISPQWLTITAVFDESGKTTHYIGSAFDISQRVAIDSEIRNMAFYDALTGLANRRLLTDRLSQAFAKSSRKQNLGAIIYIDLDRFKELNDHLGHAEGDRLLTLVADRLSTNVREGDTVARIGGDEFIILLEDLSEAMPQASEQAEGIAEKLRQALNQPYMLQGNMPDDWRCTPSIGIALFSDHKESMEALLKRADRALYAAKHAGRNTIRIDSDMPVSPVAG